jgi:hypothetical protein
MPMTHTANMTEGGCHSARAGGEVRQTIVSASVVGQTGLSASLFMAGVPYCLTRSTLLVDPGTPVVEKS